MALGPLTRMFLAITLTAVVCIGGSYALFSGDNNTRISVSGSTSLQPLMDAWQIEYEEDHAVILYISGGGSAAGRTNTLNGISDIGMASSPTASAGLEQHLVAYDGVVVVVSSNITLSNLATTDIKDIFTLDGANEKTWANYTGSGSAAAITTVVREAGSGTRDSFNAGINMSGSDTYKGGTNYQEMGSSGGVLNFIQLHDDCIGYVNMNSLAEIIGGSNVLFDKVKAISVDGVQPTADNVKKQCDSGYAAGTAYPLSRSLFVLTKTGGLTGEVKAFIQWMYSDDAQRIAEENGFVGLTDNHLTAEWSRVR